MRRHGTLDSAYALRDSPPPGDWAERAACRDAEATLPGPERARLFFPGRGLRRVPAWIVEMCRDCPVGPPCLDYALRYPVLGIWAGTTEEERVRWRRQRGAAS